MPPHSSDEFLRQQVESRHAEQQRANQNIREDIKEVIHKIDEVKDLSRDAIAEGTANRHAIVNLRQDTNDITTQLKGHDKRLISIEKRMAVAIGLATAASALLHWVFDLISPWSRHLLDAAAK